MNIRKATGSMLAIAAMAAMGAGAAQADILPQASTPTITASGTGFRFTYDIIVTSAQQVNPGNSFTIYDFAGFNDSVMMPNNWAFSSLLVSPPVATQFGTITPTDDPTLLNLVFTYTGATPIVGPQDLGNFSALTTNAGTARVSFVGRGTDQLTGLPNSNLTNALAPSRTISAVPEPSTYATFGLAGLGLLGLMVRARKTRRMTA